jgi:hypothetical protein
MLLTLIEIVLAVLLFLGLVAVVTLGLAVVMSHAVQASYIDSLDEGLDDD